MLPKLVIATINYRTPELAISCIQSVLADQDNLPPFKMYVVDNASPDNSVQLIGDFIRSSKLEDKVELIESPINGGFAYGNNVVMRKVLDDHAATKYLWILNPDTLVRAAAGSHLIKFLEQNESVAVAGSGLENDQQERQTSAFRFPTPLTEFLASMRIGFLDRVMQSKLVSMPISTENIQADWVSGASFMLTVDCLKVVGLMDDDYFLYYEEVDYFKSIQRAGYKVWHVPESLVYHQMGASTGFVDHTKKSPRRPQYWFDSKRRFFIKNYGKCGAALTDLLTIMGYSSWRVRRALQRKDDFDPPHFLNDLLKNSFLVRGFKLDHK